MGKRVWAGRDIQITVNGFTARFKEMNIELKSEKGTAKSTDSPDQQRFTKFQDCEASLIGFEDDSTSGAATWAALGNAQLAKTGLSAFSFTDTAESPASRVPTDFFTRYPYAQWLIDDVSTKNSDDAQEWTIKMTPNNLDAN